MFVIFKNAFWLLRLGCDLLRFPVIYLAYLWYCKDCLWCVSLVCEVKVTQTDNLAWKSLADPVTGMLAWSAAHTPSIRSSEPSMAAGSASRSTTRPPGSITSMFGMRHRHFSGKHRGPSLVISLTYKQLYGGPPEEGARSSGGENDSISGQVYVPCPQSCQQNMPSSLFTAGSHYCSMAHSQSPNNGILKNNCCNIPF